MPATGAGRAALCLGLPLLPGLAHYINVARLTGNPVYPVQVRLFGHTLWPGNPQFAWVMGAREFASPESGPGALVLRLVLGSAGRVVGAGALAGLAMSAVAARTLERLLFGVAPMDPLTIVAVVAVLIVTAGVAVVAPAWRATRIDPATALRTE